MTARVLGLRFMAGRALIWSLSVLTLSVQSVAIAAPPVSATREASATGDVPSAESSQLRIEEALSALADEAARATRSGDVLRIAHVEAERERVTEPLRLIDEELQIINDPNQTVQARVFATEKLAAAAEQLEQIVRRAQNFEQSLGPEESDDVTTTNSDEPSTIPLDDPTSSVADMLVMPPTTEMWPAAVSPIL